MVFDQSYGCISINYAFVLGHTLIWSNVASMQNFSFLEGVILTIPGGVGRGVGGVGELRNKTKLQPSSVEVELWLSLAILDLRLPKIDTSQRKSKIFSTVSILVCISFQNMKNCRVFHA